MKLRTFILLLILSHIGGFLNQIQAQQLHYTLSFKDPANHIMHVELAIRDVKNDTLILKLPVWMPGYYQRMKYAEDIQNETVLQNGSPIAITAPDPSTRILITGDHSPISLSYDVATKRKFVATSYLDTEMAYIVPGNTFFYPDGRTDLPVTIEIKTSSSLPGNNVATGLEEIRENVYSAPDYDILYDSPLLVGDLEELPSFEVNGVPHRFIGYKPGEFDHQLFIESLQKVVQAAVDIIGDVPFDEYKFIAIGPGRGGIEHLNNTTVSFDGSNLTDQESMIGMLNFLGHEYFHHYNAKRIRPFELGPFDYSRENRTNLLWISEGLTVYYEYIMMRMAGLSDTKRFLSEFEGHINHVENNPGRLNQSLAQSSYYTWEDGPFGKPGETISFYQKGPVVGLLLDFAIRNATENEKSLDDVMRYLYRHYYQTLGRGFTDAEFMAVCESVAGTSLADVFEYVYTSKELDYNKYLGYAGLELKKSDNDGKVSVEITPIAEPNPLQEKILKSWLRKGQ